MKLFRVILPTTDIEKAARFYGAVLGADGIRVSPGRHYFDCEGTRVRRFSRVAVMAVKLCGRPIIH